MPWKPLSNLAVALALLAATAGSALAAPLLYVLRENDAELWTIDVANAAGDTSAAVSLAGETVLGGSGLARHPTSGELYALLWLDGQSGRQLVTLDGATGQVTANIGDTGDFFTALAFDAAGTLYGLTHDLADTPSTLFTLSTATGAAANPVTLGNGGFGEALAFNPADGLLYHASGEPGPPSDERIFESIDPNNGFAITGIPLGDAFDEVLGLTPDGAGGLYMTDFLGTGGVSDLYAMASDGSVTFLRDVGFSDARGIVLVPEPASGVLAALGLLALGLVRRARRAS